MLADCCCRDVVGLRLEAFAGKLWEMKTQLQKPKTRRRMEMSASAYLDREAKGEVGHQER